MRLRIFSHPFNPNIMKCVSRTPIKTMWFILNSLSIKKDKTDPPQSMLPWRWAYLLHISRSSYTLPRSTRASNHLQNLVPDNKYQSYSKFYLLSLMSLSLFSRTFSHLFVLNVHMIVSTVTINILLVCHIFLVNQNCILLWGWKIWFETLIWKEKHTFVEVVSHQASHHLFLPSSFLGTYGFHSLKSVGGTFKFFEVLHWIHCAID